jgi:hypothetical protein
MTQDEQTEIRRTNIEKLMMGLNSSLSESHRKQYLAGHIDTLESVGEIDDEIHEVLYTEYVG